MRRRYDIENWTRLLRLLLIANAHDRTDRNESFTTYAVCLHFAEWFKNDSIFWAKRILDSPGKLFGVQIIFVFIWLNLIWDETNAFFTQILTQCSGFNFTWLCLWRDPVPREQRSCHPWTLGYSDSVDRLGYLAPSCWLQSLDWTYSMHCHRRIFLFVEKMNKSKFKTRTNYTNDPIINCARISCSLSSSLLLSIVTVLDFLSFAWVVQQILILYYRSPSPFIVGQCLNHTIHAPIGSFRFVSRRLNIDVLVTFWKMISLICIHIQFSYSHFQTLFLNIYIFQLRLIGII